jgi:hypothetical protein
MRQIIKPQTNKSNGFSRRAAPKLECLCKYCQDPANLARSQDAELGYCESDEQPEKGDYPVQRIVSATDCKRPDTKAACSAFDWSAMTARPSKVEGHMKDSARAPQVHAHVIREDGVTRHISLRYQETSEWAEKNQVRRAKQKLPKPPKQSFRLRKEIA